MRRWLCGVLLLLIVGPAQAATHTAASCFPGAVQTAMNAASAGDTVAIPAGTCAWTTGLNWSPPANVTLKGAGTSAVGGGDQTVIIDNIPLDESLLNITLPATGVFRLTGLTFQSGTGAVKDNGSVSFGGPGQLRIDHIHWLATANENYRILNIGEAVFGVLDHSLLDIADNNAIYFSNSRRGTGDTTHNMGNFEWSLPTGFGTADFFFVEDNQFKGIGVIASRMSDTFTAGRVVARFNTFLWTSGPELHATGHASDDRGGRATEVYGNHYGKVPAQPTEAFDLADVSSGPELVWGNTGEAGALNHGIIFNVTRKNNATYGQCAVGGVSCWGYCGNQFNGNTSPWDQNTSSATGYACLDQTGRGQGDILSGAFPNKTNTRTGTAAQAQQALEPVYIWANNVAPAGGIDYTDNTNGRVVANRDYYPQASGIQVSPTSPFNGTVGTGWGTLANRPTTCTTGVGYFATDQGSWNTSTSNPFGAQQNGADGVLYVCTAPNTWTLYYTPYTYPHPLVIADDGAPVLSPPTLLRIVR